MRCLDLRSLRWAPIVRSVIFLLLWVLSVRAQQSQNTQSQNTQSQNTYVGSMVCKTCHPDVWSTFYKNPHFTSVASSTEKPENTGCEGCHGPGGAHVKAHGGKATIVV